MMRENQTNGASTVIMTGRIAAVIPELGPGWDVERATSTPGTWPKSRIRKRDWQPFSNRRR